PGDASAHIFPVVLEIHTEDRLGLPEMADPVVHFLPLLRRRKQIRHRAVPYRHIVEIPYEEGATLDHHVIKIFTAHIREILACIAYGYTERKIMFFHKRHCPAHLVVYAASSPSVVGLLESFQTDGRDEILHAQHF